MVSWGRYLTGERTSVHYRQVSGHGVIKKRDVLANSQGRNTNTVPVMPYCDVVDEQEMVLCCLCHPLATVEDLYFANPFSLLF